MRCGGNQVKLITPVSFAPSLVTHVVKQIWVFTSEVLLCPTKTKNPATPENRPPEWNLNFLKCVCVISCLEQLGHLCLLMSLCWWVFSHHFPPSALPCMPLWESHHLCETAIFNDKSWTESSWSIQRFGSFYKKTQKPLSYACLPFS